MAKKKILKVIKLQIAAGKATPAPPIGSSLGAAGVNIMGFCKEFNAKTQDKAGDVLPTEITVYSDKSFTFITKQPPMTNLIKKVVGFEKGSGVPNRNKVGKITRAQALEVAKIKIQDLNTKSLDAAAAMVIGSAKSIGLDYVGDSE